MNTFPKLLTLAFIVNAWLSLAAQEKNVPYLECHYAERSIRNLNNLENIHQDEMVLSISQDCSEFYSLWSQKHQELMDSILSRGGGYQEWSVAQAKLIYPISSERTVIYKNLPEKGMLTLTDHLIYAGYKYNEKLEIPQWKILDEQQKTVAGYKCQCAQADFGGRSWIAWFAPDIPISDGPWKLCGLPGLILEAEDTEGHYHFTCIEIDRVSGSKPIAISTKKQPISTTKEEYIKTRRLCKEDISAYLQKGGKGPLQKVGKDGKLEPFKLNIKYNYIERLP